MRTSTIVIASLLGCGCLAIIAVAACAGIFLFAFRTTDAAVSPKIDALFAAIENGTFGDTYETETTPELRRTTTRKEWVQLGVTIKMRLGPLRDKKLIRFNVQQFNADRYTDAVYSATFEKGSGEIQTRLRSIGGEWRLLGFRVNSPVFLQDLSVRACPHCSEPCPTSAKFCPKCGRPLASHGENEAVSENDGSTKAPRQSDVTPKTPTAH